MNFDPKDLRPEVKKAFLEARDSALKFAENFLVDPTLGTPFRATYPQKFILGSKKRDVWVCVHRRAGKCVTGDTVVINPVTLKPTPIEKASNFTTTACFDFETNQVVWSPCTWIESGKKKCLRLDLGSGSSTSLSLDHPVFCSKRGWVPASKIKIGDRILSPSIIEIYGDLDPEQNILEFDADFSIVGNKVVDNVYRYTKKSLIAFLREVFLEKGRLLHQQSCVAFMFWSRNFCLEIRHLLLRIGVDSRIDEDGNLFIEEDVDKSVFLHTIGFDHTVTEIRSPRKWEIVTSIRKLGERTVYDLSIDHDDHNFIGDNLVLHNSYSLTIASLWHAVTKPDQKIVVFAPASTQINEFFDVLDKWIVKNPFLQALQDPVGNHKNPQKRSFTNGSTIQGYLM
jgi:intein/homing endonuclease